MESTTKQVLTSEDLKSFENDGYVQLKHFWPHELLKKYEDTVIHFHYLQALKISALRHQFEKGLNPIFYNTVEDFDRVLAAFEVEDKEAAYQATFMINCSAAAKELTSYEPFLKICSSILDCPIEILVAGAPEPFTNLPSTKRLLYKWHSESSYYPKRRNFLNIWFPIFRDKSTENGTMFFCRNSHKVEERHYVEYRGYDNDSSKKNTYLQFEIPASELTSYEKVPVLAERGDLILFSRSTVHTSTLNQSNVPSYAAVCRVMDMRRDLSLSGDMAVRPGISDYGRPGIEPLS